MKDKTKKILRSTNKFFSERLNVVKAKMEKFFFAFDPDESTNDDYLIYIGKNVALNISKKQNSRADFLIRVNNVKNGTSIKHKRKFIYENETFEIPQVIFYVSYKLFSKFIEECSIIEHKHFGELLPDSQFKKFIIIKFIGDKILNTSLFKGLEEYKRIRYSRMGLAMFGPFLFH
jgi:hypothetical protein